MIKGFISWLCYLLPARGKMNSALYMAYATIYGSYLGVSHRGTFYVLMTLKNVNNLVGQVSVTHVKYTTEAARTCVVCQPRQRSSAAALRIAPCCQTRSVVLQQRLLTALRITSNAQIVDASRTTWLAMASRTALTSPTRMRPTAVSSLEILTDLP